MNSFVLAVKCIYSNVEMIVKKLEGICLSQSKNIEFDGKKCSDGCKYQKECDKYSIRSLNHEMYLQRVLKSTPSSFEGKRCYESNIESKPWG